MEAVAKLNNSPIAPRKMQLVVDTVRGIDVGEALNILKHQSKGGSLAIEKLLLSAVSNWQIKFEDFDIEDAGLYVKQVYVTHGTSLKRFRPAPQGRAHRIRKRSNHVTMVVGAKNDLATQSVVEAQNEEVEINEEKA